MKHSLAIENASGLSDLLTVMTQLEAKIRHLTAINLDLIRDNNRLKIALTRHTGVLQNESFVEVPGVAHSETLEPTACPKKPQPVFASRAIPVQSPDRV